MDAFGLYNIHTIFCSYQSKPQSLLSTYRKKVSFRLMGYHLQSSEYLMLSFGYLVHIFSFNLILIKIHTDTRKILQLNKEATSKKSKLQLRNKLHAQTFLTENPNYANGQNNIKFKVPEIFYAIN